MSSTMAIVQQPGSKASKIQSSDASTPAGWMNKPQGRLNCPSGLEYLSMVDHILVHQKPDMTEALSGFEKNNKFIIKNGVGENMYYAFEDSDCLTRFCCGSMRPFQLNIMDNSSNQILNITREFACDSCCFPCCLQSMSVAALPGNVIGTVEQEWAICQPKFLIKDTTGKVVLRISGPMCSFTICGTAEFEILSGDGETVVGKISKQWSGLMKELFTDADLFGITFPMDLDVKMKAMCLGALFLIDAMFFESSGR